MAECGQAKRSVPPERLRQAFVGAGVPEWNANALIDLQRLYREDGASSVTDDVQQLLGRRPTSYSNSCEIIEPRFGL